MAFVEKRGDWYRLVFRHGGKRYTHALDTQERGIADGILGGVEKTLMLLKQRVLCMPAGADVLEFVLSGGQSQQPLSQSAAATSTESQTAESIGLRQFRDRYLGTLEIGSVENSTLGTVNMHFRHFLRILGPDLAMTFITLLKLQEYIGLRAKQKGIRGRPLSADTIHKEIDTLRAAWNWGVQAGLLTSPYPNKGLKFPKTAAKPPFQTWQQIERQIAQGGLDEAGKKELWDCLFLSLPEIEELLAFVRSHAIQPWVYPFFCFAAHSGARRSEVLRAQAADLDREGGTVRIRERKRVHGEHTTRLVPLSPFLAQVLDEWLAVRPSGRFLFAQQLVVFRSKKRSGTTGHKGEKTRESTLQGRLASVKDRERPEQGAITKDEAHDHFKRTLEGSKWRVLRGWHVFRHSFASNAAMKGVDQRIINAWLGHQTEEMVRRYQHLFPNQQQTSIRLIFGTEAQAQAS